MARARTIAAPSARRRRRGHVLVPARAPRQRSRTGRGAPGGVKSWVFARGAAAVPLDLAVQPPAVILLAGLQGAGKTTTAAKLARVLKEGRRKVLVVSADVYRPAAIDQLQTLAGQVGVDWFPSTASEKPVDI